VPVDEILERTGLTSHAGRMVNDLSGGERQRLQLAMALVGAPELLLLDEPTAAMDPGSRRAFWDRARASVREGATILFATHDLAEAATVADRIVVLHHGRVIADATPEELTSHGGRDLEQVFLTLTQETSATPADGGWQ
jgi:ABC-2 type transport system ATP-binding protein